MCPIEGYENGTEYLGEIGSRYGCIKRADYAIYWSGDEINIATVTDRKGYSEEGLLPELGDSMVVIIPSSKKEIVVYRK